MAGRGGQDEGDARDDGAEEEDHDERGQGKVDVGDDQAGEREPVASFTGLAYLPPGHVAGDDRDDGERQPADPGEVPKRSDQGGDQAYHRDRVALTWRGDHAPPRSAGPLARRG